MLVLGGVKPLLGQCKPLNNVADRYIATQNSQTTLSQLVPHKGGKRAVQRVQSQRSQHKPSIACSSAKHSVQATYASSEERHAILHDFCMIIPYSSLIALAGLVSIPFGNGWKGLVLAAVGSLQLFLTLQSLKRWRVGSAHRRFTAATAAIAGGLMKYSWGNAQRKVAVWPNRLLLALSAAATLFLVYNILAGGNPPKEDPAITASDSTVPQKSF